MNEDKCKECPLNLVPVIDNCSVYCERIKLWKDKYKRDILQEFVFGLPELLQKEVNND